MIRILSPMPLPPLLMAGALLLAALAPPVHARSERLDLRLTRIDLPGAPSRVLSADMNQDGRRDLVVSVAYTEWDQLAIEETTEMDDVEGLVEVLTIVPALADRRELHLFLAQADGTFKSLETVMPLGTEVLALEPGPDTAPVIALTDDGVSALRLRAGALELESLIERRPVTAGSKNFLPRMGISHDFNLDGRLDLYFPAADCGRIYLAGPQSRGDRSLESVLPDEVFVAAEGGCLPLPTEERTAGRTLSRFYPLPDVRDVNGDRLPDLVYQQDDGDGRRYFVLQNQGEGRFASTVGPLKLDNPADCDQDKDEDPETCSDIDPGFGYFGDLDGDGQAEYVRQVSPDTGEVGVRQEIREAKRPPFRYHVFRSRSDLEPVADSHLTFDALGYTFETEDDDDDDEGSFSVPGGFQDLDGDGRQDLIALTLDFSIFKTAMQVMVTRSISIGLDFHVYCQQPNGDFKAVEGLELSGKFKINLNDIKMRRLSLFDGDFDGDGRADFVQLGRGKKVSIHRGRPGCGYPTQPDLEIKLKKAPRNLALVDIDDFDADGLSDLLIVQPNKRRKKDEAGITRPVRLDLYLSGDGSPVSRQEGGR